MAREAPEDPFAGLAPDDRLLRGAAPDLEADDGADPSPVALKERALAIEEFARAVPGITNSEGAGVSAGRSVVALATSQGFARGYSTSGYAAAASVIAGTGRDMQRDSASHNVRHYHDLDSAEEIGRLAGERAVKRLGPGRLASGTMPVLFDPRVGGSLIGALLGAMSGSAIARRTSFLLGREEEALFGPGIVIVDDPHRPRGLRSKPFDGEGVATRARRLVEDGRITGWLLNSAAARQLGLETSGHATRSTGGPPGAGATNVHLEPGPLSPAALMADIKQGLYVTEMIGQGVNQVTGDYSRGASGFIIENGEIARPVDEITIAGNLIDMFRALTPADDLEHRRSVNVPTLRIDGMMVAGA
jgi:PmbA protein